MTTIPAEPGVFRRRAANGTVIESSFRAPNGSKGAPAGAQRGLIIPRNFHELTGPVVCVEGPSDVAACIHDGDSRCRPSE
jgi:hypothetical protein